MTRVDVAIVRWLASPEGWAELRDLPPYDEREELAVQQRLRARGLSPEKTAALLLQARLRARAHTKFEDFADGMLFTAEGLEQATRLQVSAVHAGRFAQASLATAHDLGCGIGADAMALSALGVTVHGVDTDAVTAAIADVNLRMWPDSRAHVGSAEDFVIPTDPLRSRVGVWFDPARRIPGVLDAKGRPRRVYRLDRMSPPWELVTHIAGLVGAAGAKLSPSFPHDALPLGSEAQWVSYAGDLLECTVWWGPLVRHQGRTALVLDRDGATSELDESMAQESTPTLASLAGLGAWLYEPDLAVTKAGLLGAVTAHTAGGEVEAGLGYISSDTRVDLPFAKRYAVLEAMPFQPKTLRAWLRKAGITGVTIKKRGIRTDEVQLRRALGLGRGAGKGAQATLVLTRVAGQQVALIVDPR
ncbi:MAG: THUMP-like domain-containing protein [Nostocoides sp.]